MKRVLTLLFLGLSIFTVTPSALAQAGGEGGGTAAGSAGESSNGGSEAAAGAGNEGDAGAEGSPDAGTGDAGAGDAGPKPNDLDLLENDGGRACSLGGPSGGQGLLIALAIAAVGIASRRRARRT